MRNWDAPPSSREVGRGCDPAQGGIHQLLRIMVERNASDLHIKVGSPPGLRLDGHLRAMGEEALRPEDTRALVEELLTPAQLETFQSEGDLDLSVALSGLSRFRVNVLTQRGSAGIVVRRIPTEIPTLSELGLPDVCRQLAGKSRGLVLVTGPTGSGKSTTLAAMIDHVNSTRRGHILTMEDPIEFAHNDKMCWVTQREIGSDSKNFASALKRALRQDPDVILVGEMRDLETIALAVTAAETGHLVFATLHTTSAVQTVNRIVDVFPPAQQRQIRMQLADNLQGVVSQKLVARKPRGRAAATEILVGTDAVRALVREGKTSQLQNMLQTGAKDGMRTLEASLIELVGADEITSETALTSANKPAYVRKALGDDVEESPARAPMPPRHVVAPPAPDPTRRPEVARRTPNYGL